MIRLSRIACVLPERSSAYGPWDAGRCAVPGSGAPSSSRTGSAGCEPVLAIENHQPLPYVPLPAERRSKTPEYRNRPNPPTRCSKRATVHGGHASVSVACRFQSGGCPGSLSRRSGGGGRTGRKTDHCFFRGRIFCIDRRCRAVCAPSLLFHAAGCTFREDLSRSGSRTVRNVVPELSLPGGADRVCRRQESFGREVRAWCIRKKRLSGQSSDSLFFLSTA